MSLDELEIVEAQAEEAKNRKQQNELALVSMQSMRVFDQLWYFYYM